MNDIIKVLKYLKQNRDGCDYPNDLDNLQRTPLMWACNRGYDKMVCILLDYGADIQTKDSFGRTALDIATIKEHKEIVNVSSNIRTIYIGFMPIFYFYIDTIKC